MRHDHVEPELLLPQARDGNVAAQGELLDSYRSYLLLLARMRIGRHLQGKADPADVVQETFLEAHRDFARFQGTTEAELVGWLRRILASNLADLTRRLTAARRDVRLEAQLVDDLDRSSRALDQQFVAPGSSPSQRAVRRERAVLLAEALESLPEDYREVIVLRHLEGLSFPDVAGRMGRTLDSVKNLWARGLKRLREALGGQHE